MSLNRIDGAAYQCLLKGFVLETRPGLEGPRPPTAYQCLLKGFVLETKSLRLPYQRLLKGFVLETP